MTIIMPTGTYYSSSLDRICEHVKRIHENDKTRRFRIRRNTKGFWRMEVY